MIKKSNITKKIGTTALIFSLACIFIKNVHADRVSSTTKEGVTTLEIGCTVTVQKPTCNTDVKYILPAANDYGNFTLNPNQTAEISVVNPDSKKVGFVADIEVKGYIDAQSLSTPVTIATIKNVGNTSLQKPFIIKNNFSKAARVFIVVNNLTVDAPPSMMKQAQIKVIGKVSFQESYTTKDDWKEVLLQATTVAKEAGFSQPFGCTVSALNEQCTVPFAYSISRGESINLSVNFGPNPPKNVRADWQVSSSYLNNGNFVGTTLSTVQTSYKNETKTFINNTDKTVYVFPKIINFTHKDGSTSQSQVTISFEPDFKNKK
jgi:hypothetical protein